MVEIGHELRLAARGLRRSLGFTVSAVVTLALGIGANAAIFTGVEAALMRPLPYGEAERLVHLWETTPENARRQLSYPDFLDVRDGATSFAAVAGYGFFGATFEGSDGAELLAGARVSSNFFATLGVTPLLGRGFAAEEDAPGRPRDVVVLSHGAWKRRFGGDPGVVGRAVRLSAATYTVIGVLPRDFHFARLGEPEIFVTLSPPATLAERRFTHWMWGIARLRPGVDLAAARAELATIAGRRAAADARWHAATDLAAVPLREAFVGQVRPLLLGLLAGAGAVLLVACANVASMTLARTAGREREIAVRLALGVGRAGLLRQFLAESLLVALAGGALGLVVSFWGVRALAAAVPADRAQFLPFLADLRPSSGVLVFTLAISLATTLAVGVAPALRRTGRRLDALRGGARGASARQPLRHGLVVGQIALALVLLSAAGLMTRSLYRLLRVEAGFDRERLLTAFVALPKQYDTPEKRIEAFRALGERLGSMPGAAGAATVDRLPLGGSGNTGTPTVVGRPPADESGLSAEMRSVSAGYFRVAGVPLLSGRGFTEADGLGSPRVVLVNRRLAEELFAGADPAGERVSFVFMNDEPLEIVGVVGDENVADLDAGAPPAIYFPESQSGSSSAYFVVRTTVPPATLARTLTREARAFETEILVGQVAAMDDLVASSPPVFLRRFPLLLFGGFAGLALALAAIGVYGVIAYSVARRTREFGIRMAVGAQLRDVRRLVLRQGAGVALAGVALGALGAWGAGRLLSRLLFATSPFDLPVLAAAAATLTAAALAACAIPARRAARVDPVVALRSE